MNRLATNADLTLRFLRRQAMEKLAKQTDHARITRQLEADEIRSRFMCKGDMHEMVVRGRCALCNAVVQS